MAKLLVALSFALLPACADDPQPVPGGEVVGTWRTVPDADGAPSEDLRDVVEFTDDGACSWKSGSLAASPCTYTLAEGRVAMAFEANTREVPYYADGARLLFGILVPDDDGADPVATWSGASDSTTGGHLDVELVLGSDASAHIEQTTDEGTDAYDGTWVQVGDDVRATFPLTDNTSWSTGGSLYAGFLGTAFEPI